MITETLALRNGVSAPANAMAAAVDRVSAAAAAGKAYMAGLERKARDAATAARALKAAAASLKALPKISAPPTLKPVVAPTRAAAKITDSFGAAVAKARAAMLKEHAAAKVAAAGTNSLGGAAKKAGGAVGELNGKKLLGGFVGPSMALGILGVAMGVKAIGTAALAAAQGAASLVYEFAKGVIEAKLLRDNAKAMQDTLSGGRGADVLKLLHSQAIATGQSFDDLNKATIASRESGLNYGEAFKLNNLRGDIIAVTGSAEKADAAIAKALAEVKSGSKTAAQAQAELAKQYNVAGDGAKAHEKSMTTLGGALDRLKAAPGNIFAKIAEKSGPELDKLGAKVSKLLEDFNTGAAAGLVAGLSTAMDALAVGLGIAAELVGPLWAGFKEGIAPLTAMIGPIGEALSKAFGSDKKDSMSGLATAAQMVGRAIGVLATAVIAPIIGLAMLGAAIGKVMAWFEEMKAAAINAGLSVVEGLAEGLRNPAKVIEAARDLAEKVKRAIKDALKIGSPSKVMAEMGRFTAAGMATGIEQGTPAVAAAGQQMAGAPVAAAASSGGGRQAAPAGGGGFTLQLSVAANPGATQADGQALASGIVPVIRREIASWLEGRMIEAGA